MTVTMTCMTTKKKFDVEDPEVVVLNNGRYAYKVECPWKGKNDRKLTAFKFCSTAAHQEYEKRKKPAEQTEAPEEAPEEVASEESEEEQTEAPEEP